jgi:branched-chain amino acid transport system substrate-binding protein
VARGGLLSLVLAGLLLAGCGGEAEPELEPGTLAIGAVVGPTAWDAEVVSGIRTAVRELDRRGGVDGEVSVRLRVGSARRLVAAGTRILVLPCDARSQAASAAAVRRSRLLVLAPCNTGIWRRFPDVWPVSASAAAEGRVLARYLREQEHRRVAVLGQGRAAHAVRRAVRGEDLVLAPPSAADAVAVALAAPFAQPAVSRLRARGIGVPVVATHGMDDVPAIRRHRDSLDGVVFTTFGFAEPGSELDELSVRHLALTGEPLAGSVGALGYDAVKVLETVLQETGSLRPAVLASGMPGLEAYGATGRIAYPKDGGRDPQVSVALVRIADGDLQLVDRVRVP